MIIRIAEVVLGILSDRIAYRLRSRPTPPTAWRPARSLVASRVPFHMSPALNDNDPGAGERRPVERPVLLR